MPSFVFSPTDSSGSSELVFRNPFGSIFDSEKLARILSDDLFFGITQYVLRAGIPVGHESIHIGHENRIVSNVLDCLSVDVFSAAIYAAAFSDGRHD